MSVARRRLADAPDGRERFHFLVQWRDRHGIQHARMFATLDEAVGYDGAVKAGRVARDVPTRAVPITFGQSAAAWLRTKQRTKRSGTSTLYECELRCRVLPYFAHTPLVAIRRRDVQDWVDALAASGLAPATVRHCYRAVFKSIINTAVLDGLLEVSPCYRIEQPEPHPQRFDPLTPQQVTAIARRAPERYRALILVAAACGTRFGESAGLGRSHVLVEPRLLAVDRQLDRHNSSSPSPARTSPCAYAACCGATFAPPKSAAGERTIPLPDLALQALTDHITRIPLAPCGLLFTTPTGKALNPANWRARVWRPLTHAIPQVPDTTTYHHLRHTYASLLGDAGLAATEIAARLGHASTGQSEAYVHPYPDPDEGKATRDAIDQAFSGRPRHGSRTPVNTPMTGYNSPEQGFHAEDGDFVD